MANINYINRLKARIKNSISKKEELIAGITQECEDNVKFCRECLQTLLEQDGIPTCYSGIKSDSNYRVNIYDYTLHQAAVEFIDIMSDKYGELWQITQISRYLIELTGPENTILPSKIQSIYDATNIYLRFTECLIL